MANFTNAYRGMYPSCNEFESSLLKDKCEDISVSIGKKCSYFNNNCIEVYEKCLDLKGEGINEEICIKQQLFLIIKDAILIQI